ncbi:MAG: FAD-dependent oxidoreductase, partial [bacterium]
MRLPARNAALDPTESFNADLLSHVHPPDWTNPTPADRYHLVVVGAGTAGLIAASFAAGAGARVALVERHLMGGDCLNVGCVPSKTIIRSSRVFAELRDAASLGWRMPPGAEANFGAVMERMRRIRARISPHDSAARYRDEKGIDVFLGSARFTGESRLDVDGTALRFKKAVIATGARAASLPIAGLAEAGVLTNESVFNLTTRPRRLAVIGGGPIGAELAQAFCRLGCEVTLLEVMDHILGREDPDAAAIVQAALVRDGVRLRLACQIERVERQGDHKVVHLAGDGVEPLMVDEVLVGVGRTPNIEGLGLDAAGVNHDAKGVTVDDALQTSNPRIYAAGDVCMAWKFTHAAEDAARIAVQ